MSRKIEKSTLRASYGTQIKRDFGAEPYQWNFAKDPQKAKNVVNAKVAKTSNGALKRFLEPGMAVQKCSFYYGATSTIFVLKHGYFYSKGKRLGCFFSF